MNTENMMKKCDILRKELESRTGSTKDMLAEYRSWFDGNDISSEKEDGWPEDFVFEKSNIDAFVEHWWGE